MLDKGTDYWLTLAGLTMYAAFRDAEKAPFGKRVAKILSSVLIALGSAGTVAAWFDVDELLAMAFLVVFSHLILDIGFAILSDRDMITGLIRKHMGGGRDKDG